MRTSSKSVYARTLAEVKEKMLVNHLNRPDKDAYSDHLPIVFTIKGE